MKIKQKIIGTYYIGRDCVEVVLREGDGGEFYFIPELGHIPRIKIGAGYDEWREIVSVLLHEAMEFVMSKLKHRYSKTEVFPPRESSDCVFILSHSDFSDVCARVADLISCCIGDLKTEWENWKEKESAKR